MPLEKGTSESVVGRNIRREQDAGKPHDQAVAIALHTADESYAATSEPAADRSTCEVRGWPVFSHGLFKPTNDYFSPSDVKAFGQNFAKYSGAGNRSMRPLLKLGHDREQRYAKSLGLPSIGEITAAHTDDSGVFWVDQAINIPRIVGSAINSGFLVSGSVELPPRGAWRPPDDPNAEIEGDIVSGVALLGEEMPAVPGFPPPKAVFADGSPVPPLTDAEQIWWLENISPILSEAGNRAANTDKDAYSARVLCFSATTYEAAMDPNAIDPTIVLAYIQSHPELIPQIQALAPAAAAPMGDMAPVEPVPATNETFSSEGDKSMDKEKKEGEEAPPWFSAFTAKYAADCDSMAKRMGALEAKESSREKDKGEHEMSAMKARVFRAWKEADADRKFQPVVRDTMQAQGLAILQSKTFSSVTDQDTAFDGWVQGLLAAPVHPALKDSMTPGGENDKKKPSTVSELAKAMVAPGSFLDKHRKPVAAARRAALTN